MVSTQTTLVIAITSKSTRDIYGNIVERLNNAITKLSKEIKKLLVSFKFSMPMVKDFLHWREKGMIYGGSNGSVFEGHWAYSFVFSSGVKETTMWGSAATTPWSKN